MADTVLVTGASGYIAGHCILQLLDRGYAVRGTLRSLGRADEVRNWLVKARDGRDPAEMLSFVATTLDADDGWADAMTGVRYVLHVASPIPPALPKHPDDLIVPARDGTLRVMHAAAAAQVERVVQTSSTAAVTNGHRGNDGHIYTEADWTDPDGPDVAPYSQSKTIAERAAWAELPRLGRALEWTTVNPSLVLGPVLDRDASPSVAVVSKMLRGEVPGLPRFNWPMVDVRDLADLHLRVMTAPQAAGQRFLGSGPTLWMEDVARILKAHLGNRARKVPTRRLPDALVRLFALFDKEVKGQIHELGRVRPVSSAKAEAMLGWRCRPLEETIADTAESLFAVGAV